MRTVSSSLPPLLMPHIVFSPSASRRQRQKCLSSKLAFKIGLPRHLRSLHSLLRPDNHRSSSSDDDVEKNVLNYDDRVGQDGQHRLRPHLPRRHPRRGMVSHGRRQMYVKKGEG